MVMTSRLRLPADIAPNACRSRLVAERLDDVRTAASVATDRLLLAIWYGESSASDSTSVSSSRASMGVALAAVAKSGPLDRDFFLAAALARAWLAATREPFLPGIDDLFLLDDFGRGYDYVRGPVDVHPICIQNHMIVPKVVRVNLEIPL